MRFMRWYPLVCLLFLTSSYGQDRIRAVPDDTRTVKLTGNRHPSARAQDEVGSASPGHRMDKMILVLDSGAERKDTLDALITEQQNPASALYQHWLTPEAFADRFGVSQNDVDQVTLWLEGHGFRIDEIPAGRRTIVFSGTARMVEAAFHTQIRQYRVNGALYYANSSDPEIPEALAAVVAGPVTLHDFARRSMRSEKQALPDFSSGGSYYMGPADFAAIYNLNPLYSAGIDGTGKSIAIVGRSNINLADVQTFRNYFGLPVNNPQIILNGPNPGINGDEDEAVLDVEWSGAVAPKATVKFVVSASTNATDGVDLSAQYIVANNVAPVMSTSYSSCEAAMGSAEMAFYRNLWQQAAAQGISTMISSGDAGAAGCDAGSESLASSGKAVNGLCSSIYSVCVGGTQFNDTPSSAYWLSGMSPATKESAISYIPEMAWNQSGSGSGLWATGGGVSAVYTKPSWQSGPGVPADGKRDVPDISLPASRFLIVENGSLYLIGGTSASSPSFAGIMALVDQKNGAQGNPNPTLYALAAIQGRGHAYFHDVTTGTNTVPGLTGYTAGAGYDLATGLGSVNGSNLVNYWGDSVAAAVAPSMSAGMSVAALTIRQGASATSSAIITVAGGYSSAVAVSVSGAPAGVTATLASTSIAAPGSGTIVLTVAVGTAAVPGSSTITVTATGGGVTSSTTVSLTILQTLRVWTSVSAISVQQGSGATLTAGSDIAGGFAGAVTLKAGTLPVGLTIGFAPSTIATPGSGTSALTIAASSLAAVGTYSIAITGTSGSLISTAKFTVTVVPAAVFTLSAALSNVTVMPGASATTTITMTPGSGLGSNVTLTTGSLPSGIMAQLSSASIGRAGGKVTLTAAASSKVAAGSYPITVTGTGGGVSQTVVVTLVVSGFTVKTTSPTASLVRNSSVLLAIQTSVTDGFSGAVRLAVSGLPAGVSAIFTPQAIANPAAGTSSLRLTAPALAQVGSRTITLTATSAGGSVQTAAVSLTVH
jgi:pseudomonalisin